MKNGSAKAGYIDFPKYRVPRFAPLSSNTYGWRTCGSASLSVLTGKKARDIEKSLPKNQVHWSDAAVCKYLRARGFYVRQITKQSLYNHRKVVKRMTNAYWINPLEDIVILANLAVDEQASWFVVHNNTIWHNFDRENFSLASLLSYPSQSLFLVWKKNWKINNPLTPEFD